MNVLPVIDLLGGKIVHAVRGERSRYQPVTSRLGNQGDVNAISTALADDYGFGSAYVADLGALQGQTPDWDGLATIRSRIANLWVDAGIANVADVAGRGFGENMILSTESVSSPAEFASAVAIDRRTVFSVDMRQQKVISKYANWNDQTPEAVIGEAVSLGFQRLLLLDLAAVGNAKGPCLVTLIRETRNRYPGIEITSGGGIRNLTDLQQLKDAGCDYALIATGLHHGPFLPDVLPNHYIG